MGAIYPGACQVVVPVNLEPEGGKCRGVMHMNKKYAFSQSRILQVVQPRPQPSESGVPTSLLQTAMGSSRWDGSRWLQRHFLSSGHPRQSRVGMGRCQTTFPCSPWLHVRRRALD